MDTASDEDCVGVVQGGLVGGGGHFVASPQAIALHLECLPYRQS